MTMTTLFLVLVAILLQCIQIKGNKCERLKSSLSYTQEKAPRDLSGVLPVVVERVNRELEGVVDVEVEWTGSDLHGRVGEHVVQCKVTRLLDAVNPDNLDNDDKVSTDEDGRKVIVQCFQLPFTIADTNECVLPASHSMHHKCAPPSICVNTVGSYECVCPRHKDSSYHETVDQEFWTKLQSQERDEWEKSFRTSNDSSCPGSASTHGCCDSFGHSNEGKICRAAFRCPMDPCKSSKLNDCASNARCTLSPSPLNNPNYKCQCPNGLMGNGLTCRSGIDPEPKPMLRFDGVTPTEETIKNNYYCGCTKPRIDACDGFPPCKGNHEICATGPGNNPMCVCKPGYVNNNDGYGCVDETPPLLKLRYDPDGDQTLRLKQGDTYQEHAVDIMDENAEEYLRSLRITYSKPLPPGCLLKVGEFHVNYTVATPWTSPPYVRVTRRVIIEDIDECNIDVAKYEATCPELIPQCDFDIGATCRNTIGSYSCRCPPYTSGDGFKTTCNFASGEAPEGYNGGTGCVDTTKPTIAVLGPNPKVFKVCKCGGLGGSSSPDSKESFGKLVSDQRDQYERDLKNLIASTSGGELCSTHANPSPKHKECVKASDKTHRGIKDLTERVEIGDPMKISALHWRVPYDVMDNAGNKAVTAYREVLVEEVDRHDLANKIRAEVMAEKDKAIKQAVKKALTEDRKYRKEQVEVAPRSQKISTPEKSCPRCPDCNCEFDPSKCTPYCEQKYGKMNFECPAEKSLTEESLMTLYEHLRSSSFYTIFSSIATFACCILLLRFMLTLAFNPGAFFGTTNYNDNRGPSTFVQSPLMGTATPPGGPNQGNDNHPAYSDPSFARRGGGVQEFSSYPRGDRHMPEAGLFSPPQNRLYASPAADNSNSGIFDDSIYASSPSSNGGRQRSRFDDFQTITPSKTGDYRGR